MWQTDNHMTVCCIFMSDVSTKVSFFFIKKRTNTDTEDTRALWMTSEAKKKSAELKRQNFCGYWFAFDDLSCVLKLRVTVTVCCSSPNYLQKIVSMLASTHAQKKRFLYRSEERRPKHLQVLIQLGLLKSPGHTVLEPRMNARKVAEQLWLVCMFFPPQI